jgi:small ligand-binding sensory domain FIST
VYAAALSRHREPAEAVAEVIGAVLERTGAGVDAAVLFVSPHHVDAVHDMAAAVRTVLRPGALVGATAVAVVAGRTEVEDEPGVALWVGLLDGVRAVRFSALPGGDGHDLIGPGDDELAEAHSLVLLADPYTFPVDGLVEQLSERHPHICVVGGLASAPSGPGGNRLLLDAEVHRDGAVGLLLSGSVRVDTIVSQGCRPIGSPMVVTSADGNLVHELAGRPAVERLRTVLAALTDEEKALAQQGLHVGRVVDEHRVEFERGDFPIRGVLGIDRGTGALAVGDRVPIGATIQFQVRDAESAHDDLTSLLSGAGADGALVFTCNGRGTNMFAEPNHDAETVSEWLGDVPLAGMFCAGEIGPVGGRSFVHGFTASLALFRSTPGAG